MQRNKRDKNRINRGVAVPFIKDQIIELRTEYFLIVTLGMKVRKYCVVLPDVI